MFNIKSENTVHLTPIRIHTSSFDSVNSASLQHLRGSNAIILPRTYPCAMAAPRQAGPAIPKDGESGQNALKRGQREEVKLEPA